MATPRDHSAGLAGLVPASHLLLASLPGYLSAGLAPARGRPRVSETWSDQPPACFASFARVLTSLLRISCSRPHNVGPAHPDPPVLPALPRAREQRRPQMTSSASARTSPPRRARRWTAPLSPGALPSRHGDHFPEFCAPRGSKLRRLSGLGDPPTKPGTHQPQATTARTGAADTPDRPVCPV